MEDTSALFEALARSWFRSRFRLGPEERQYLHDKGLDTIIEHACQFIVQRLGDAQPRNDGRQTPMRGHPVFIAQHATAACCRKCLAKWHSIAEGKSLSDEQVEYVLMIIRRWIEKQGIEPGGDL
jgi:hypothetical protein